MGSAARLARRRYRPGRSCTQSNGTPSQSATSCEKRSHGLVRSTAFRSRGRRGPRRHRDFGPLARRPAGELDVVCDRDAAACRARAAARRRCGKPSQSAERKRAIHHSLVFAAVIGHAERVAPTAVAFGAESCCAGAARPDRSRGRGREVDQPLDHVHRLGPAGAAIGIGARRVAHARRAPAVRAAGMRVEARNQLHALVEGHERGGVGADIADDGSLRIARNRALGIERKLCR